MKLNLLSGKEILTFERSDDEIARVRGQVGDIADGARARTFRGAERLAHEVRDVGFAVFARGSRGLDEHGLQSSRFIVELSNRICVIFLLLLATHFVKTPTKLMFLTNSSGT